MLLPASVPFEFNILIKYGLSTHVMDGLELLEDAPGEYDSDMTSRVITVSKHLPEPTISQLTKRCPRYQFVHRNDLFQDTVEGDVDHEKLPQIWKNIGE